MDVVFQRFYTKINETKTINKFIDVDHPDAPLVNGITRLKMKRILYLERINENTLKMTDLRNFTNMGFLFPLPNFVINLLCKFWLNQFSQKFSSYV